MQVEIFTGFTEKGLSNKVNRFVENESIEVVDIKFSVAFFYMSAMVMYEARTDNYE